MFQTYLTQKIQHPPLSKVNVKNLIVYSPSIQTAYGYALKWIRYNTRAKMKKMRKQIVETKKEDFVLPTSDAHIEINFEVIQTSMKEKFTQILKHLNYLYKTQEGMRHYILLLNNFQYVENEDIYFHLLDGIPMRKVIITNTITNTWEYVKSRKWEYSYIKIPGSPNQSSNIQLQKLFVYAILKPFNIFEIRDKIYDVVIHLYSIDDIVWYITKKVFIELPDISQCSVVELIKELYEMRDLYQRDTYYIEWFVLSIRKFYLDINKNS